jgi:hypothetical protein
MLKIAKLFHLFPERITINMDASILKYLIPGVIGLIAGIVGSLIAPWVHWGVEKRRTRQAKRREMISSCRMLLSTDIDKKTFRETEAYSKIRPHLQKHVVDEVADKHAESAQGEGTDPNLFKQNILEDIAGIEKEWVLI